MDSAGDFFIWKIFMINVNSIRCVPILHCAYSYWRDKSVLYSHCVAPSISNDYYHLDHTRHTQLIAAFSAGDHHFIFKFIFNHRCIISVDQNIGKWLFIVCRLNTHFHEWRISFTIQVDSMLAARTQVIVFLLRVVSFLSYGIFPGR